MRKLLIALLLVATELAAAESIDRAFTCGRNGEAGGLPDGTDLVRKTVDVNRFPSAVCNDGSPAVYYVRRYAKEEDRNKWVIFLQGGGSCDGGQSCFERWCSTDTNFGKDKMSSRFSKMAIRGDGILSKDDRNRFAGWNKVLIYYCSSDSWSGTRREAMLKATLPDGREVEYTMGLNGGNIIDAVLASLRTVRTRVVGTTTEAGASQRLPNLDDATSVILAGSSAGGAGARLNIDRVAALLKSTNKSCNPGACPLDVRGAFDASYQPDYRRLDFNVTTLCASNPELCTYESFFRSQYNNSFKGLRAGRGDASCESFHAPTGTEYLCVDTHHLQHNHINTPFFMRFDHQDELHVRNFAEARFASAFTFGSLVHDGMQTLTSLDVLAEEGSPRTGVVMKAPGIFGPQCLHHESFTHNPAFFEVRVPGGGQNLSFHDVLWNWWSGGSPQVVIRPFTAAGPAPECSRAN